MVKNKKYMIKKLYGVLEDMEEIANIIITFRNMNLVSKKDIISNVEYEIRKENLHYYDMLFNKLYYIYDKIADITEEVANNEEKN